MLYVSDLLNHLYELNYKAFFSCFETILKI